MSELGSLLHIVAGLNSRIGAYLHNAHADPPLQSPMRWVGGRPPAKTASLSAAKGPAAGRGWAAATSSSERGQTLWEKSGESVSQRGHVSAAALALHSAAKGQPLVWAHMGGWL